MPSNATYRGRANILKRPNRLNVRSGSVASRHPRIERVGIHQDKASQASAGVPRSSGCRPIGEQPDTPSASAGHGTGCTWRITRDEWLSAR